MKNWKILSLTISVSSVLLSGFVGQAAVAESLVISENGSGSVSEVKTDLSQSTNVTQDNTAEVVNNVNTETNTGNNSTSDNNGAADIQTGNVSTSVDITTDVNANLVTSNCCEGGSVTGVISGNGSNSINTFNFSNSNNTNVSSTNNANIVTNINGYANTGNNRANNNNGNTMIQTGGIYVSEKVYNQFNISSVEVGIGGITEEMLLLIKGNGTGSTNTINFENNNDVNIITTNIASIVNNIDWDLNTGNNLANGNIGKVDLKTGDIVFQSEISNVGNANVVTVKCCEEKAPPVIPPVPNNPKPGDKPSENGRGGSDGGSSSGGDTLGTAIGNVLPSTGVNLFILALIGNIAMLFLGMYLRLRSGRSPAVLAAI